MLQHTDIVLIISQLSASAAYLPEIWAIVKYTNIYLTNQYMSCVHALL